MYKIIPFAKSLFILGFAILAIFLSGQLWFVQFTNHSFVPYVQARFAPSVPDDASELVRPFRIVAGAGDGYFGALYGRTAGAAFWAYGERVIASMLRNGIFVQVHDAKPYDILSHGVIVYEYAFNMDVAVFAQAFGGRTSNILTDHGMNYNFYMIAIQPPHEQSDMVRIFFIGEDAALEFVLGSGDNEFNMHIPSASELARKYVQDGDSFNFVMQLHRNFTYHPILVTNPYVNRSGFLHLSFIRERIEHFFDNPATINQGMSGDNVYTFSNVRTVVRYHPWDVVEYSSFRTIGRNSSAGFISDFSAAFAFVQSDPNINNEIFLAGFEVQGRETIFWFNYAIDNFPLRLGEPWYTGPDCVAPLLYPIEVVVDHGRVVRYRKLALNFVSDETVTARPELSLLNADALEFRVRPHYHLRLVPVTEGR